MSTPPPSPETDAVIDGPKKKKPWTKPTILVITDGALATESGSKVHPPFAESTQYRPVS